MHIDQLSAIVHEANRAYCVSINDHSQVPWEIAPAWQRESAMAGIKKLAADPSLTPETLHAEWCDHKYSTGWSYGPVKDADTMKHPCLVPYAQLPEDQRIKDVLFAAIVRPFLDTLEIDIAYEGAMEG